VDWHKVVESSGRNQTSSVGARGTEEKEDKLRKTIAKQFA
jgi:hypothetical protein